MTTYRPERRSPRLQGFDYTQNGAYFVTICTHHRTCLFGDVVGGMKMSRFGHIADTRWRAIPDHFAHVELDEFVVMPNYVHGIVVLLGKPHVPTTTNMEFVGTRHAVSTIVYA